MILANILLATLLVSLVSLVGVVFFFAKLKPEKVSFYLISIASGTMLGGAFFHLIPESFEHNTAAAGLIGAGVFFFFILEKFLIWQHCHTHPHAEAHHRPKGAAMVLIGDGIHNLIDGMIIASGFMVDLQVGWSVAAAVILHEIPQEVGDFGVLMNAGYSLKKAAWANVLSATLSVLGGLVAYFFLGALPVLQTWAVPVVAGGFLYIALADLIPQLHEHVGPKDGAIQVVLLALGFGVMMLLAHAH